MSHCGQDKDESISIIISSFIFQAAASVLKVPAVTLVRPTPFCLQCICHAGQCKAPSNPFYRFLLLCRKVEFSLKKKNGMGTI